MKGGKATDRDAPTMPVQNNQAAIWKVSRAEKSYIFFQLAQDIALWGL
jgi:hypothetical protein